MNIEQTRAALERAVLRFDDYGHESGDQEIADLLRALSAALGRAQGGWTWQDDKTTPIWREKPKFGTWQRVLIVPMEEEK